ncbi:hypothetical protein [Paraglaciecola hydrolytica]|uniref:Rap1a immunity protein domain-containing protein n=1 Tax=Paraglaciecola hydrolytica TaxID=1799789 RepID=A0A148KLR7_9ALTE|nr:hypothetical protein [Paraglaciecola hydrolytica]KXI27256.1 hypothetical protein AX660_21225 [Paraglaciecola hydrolytica]
MLKHVILQISVLVVLLAAFNAKAVEKMNAAELQAVCQAFASKKETSELNNNKSLCSMYLKGFLAGENLYRAETLPPATFREKALASRAGGLLEKYQLGDDISYCIPKSTNIEDIAILINKQRPAADDSAESLIKSVLQQNFQCAK